MIDDLSNITGQKRNQLLKDWCNQEKGRTSKLSERVFEHTANPKTAISHYKNNREIKDDIWNKMITEILVIESLSGRTKPKVVSTEFENFTQKLYDWLAYNPYIKLYMSDAIYQHVYNDAEFMMFTKIYKKQIDNLDDLEIKQMLRIMETVDSSMINKDQYYLCALKHTSS